MTERALRLAPTAGSALADPATGTSAAAGSAATLRSAAEARSAVRPVRQARRPAHVAVAIGVTAGLYAVSLAGVTALQSGTDARLAAERAPAAAAVDALRTNHDQAEAELARIAAGLTSTGAAYQQVADDLARHEAALGSLGKRIAAVEGSAASLRVPSVARLPSVSARTVYVSSRPASNACTTASGKPC
jgi:hypothetical protein